MSYYPPSSSLILVCVLPALKDLEIARVLGWYRIPLRRAPKVIDVDFLAFYQTGAFGSGHNWRIEYFAEMRGHELTTRKELIREELDHPRADEEYFKIQIGPLELLPMPITTQKWRRMTFLYTTGRHLQSARTLNDLVVKDEEREILWHSLRERAGRQQKYSTSPKLDLDQDMEMDLIHFLLQTAGK